MEKLNPMLRFPNFNDVFISKKIGDVCNLTTGNKDTQNKIDDGIYPFFVRSQTVERINSYSYDGEAILTSGDGVGVGKNFHYINGKFDFHQRVYCLHEFKEGVFGKYVYHYFSEKFLKRITRMNAKNSVDSVRREMIFDMPIFITSYEEQTRIANFLSAIDEKLNLLKEKKALLEDYKKGIMQNIFNQEIRFKDDNGSDFEDWAETCLGKIGEIITGKTPSTTDSDLWNGDIQFITPTDIKEGIKYQERTDRYVTKNSKLKVLPSNSIVYTCIASIGKMCISKYPSITNQQINSIIINKLNSFEYVYYWLLYITPFIKSTQANTTLPIINKTDFSKFSIKLPCIKEQTKIANFISAIDEKIELVSNQIQDTQEYKKGLLQQMFV